MQPHPVRRRSPSGEQAQPQLSHSVALPDPHHNTDAAPSPSGGSGPAPKPAEAAEIRSRALKLLTTREHSRYELWRKLHRRGYPAEDVNAVLDQLAAEGLLSEERMLAAYVAERLEKGFGPLRIRAELHAKGLPDSAIDPHLDLQDGQCLALIARVDAAKFGEGPPNDRQTLAKRARFLEYRGFPARLIARALKLA
jgi:regulatory protein